MGLNQSSHGTWHSNAICNLHLATGKICRPGSGPFSLTGQPNAMGGREMGYMGPGLPGQRSVLVEDDRHFIEDMWGIPRESLRTEVGTGTISMFQSMIAGDIKACWIICTNPVASTFGAGDPPDNGESFWQALQADNAPCLPDLRYTVLGFGDSSYDLFCRFARNLDIRLEQLGAQRLRGRVDCDTDLKNKPMNGFTQLRRH
ncbi:flavodoxin domain-containing protein [Ectobacillus funiculus]